MKYKLKVGPSTEFYYSSIEKAALAMRSLVEADGGAAYVPYTLASAENADIKLEPIWPENAKMPALMVDARPVETTGRDTSKDF